MRIPDPIANTTTEAYLAYKAGVLSEGELKPKLYDPTDHFDAWLAYWSGVSMDYPKKGVLGKNLLMPLELGAMSNYTGEKVDSLGGRTRTPIKVTPGETYIFSASGTGLAMNVLGYSENGEFIGVIGGSATAAGSPFTVPNNVYYINAWRGSVVSNAQLEVGSTITPYEEYKQEPELLNDEEALVAYLADVTDTYPDSVKDPYDVRIAGYLRYLVSARWGRPEYPVTNEELYLSMMDAPYIPAGEPSSDIEIDDTAEAPFKDVKMYGDTSQTTYTGKNLLGLTSTANITSNGVESFWNGSHLAFSGKATSTQVFLSQYIANNFPAGSYVLSLTEPAASRIIFRFFDGNNSTLKSFTIEAGESSVAVNLDGTEAKYRFVMLAGVGVEYNRSYDIQLEAGSSPTSFEPYVGGVPAPNPDYPQAVNTVTGRQVVKVEGKNLFNIETTSNRGVDLTYDAETGKMVFSGTPTGTWAIFTPPESIKIPAGEYTISIQESLPFIIGLGFTTAGGTRTTKNIAVGSTSSTFTIAEESTLDLAIASLTSGVYMSAEVFFQLEKGSTATDYLPYQSGEYEINLGKNLVQTSFASETANGVTKELNSDGTITLNGHTTAGHNFKIAQDIKLKAGQTYTLSAEVFGGSFTPYASGQSWAVMMNMLNGSTIVLSLQGITSSGGSVSYTPPTDMTCSINLWFGRNSSTTETDAVFTDFNFGVQIETGSQKTSYAPYFTPIELCKIGDYQDYIYENDGKWYLHKATGKYTFNDTSIFTWGGDRNRFYIGETALNNLGVDYVWPTWTQTDLLAFSDKFKATNFTYGYNNATTGALCMVSNTGTLSFRNVGVWTNADGAKLELAGTIFYYAHTTPTDAEITNTALIDQLNALKNGGSYTGTTYIKVSATDPNLPGLLEVEAYKYD